MKELALPPAIMVESPDLAEDQVIQGIVNAATRDNFAVGNYAVQWCERYSRDRSDKDLANLVNDASPDVSITGEFIRQCRVVSKEFPTRVGNLSWTHHRVAVLHDRANAKKWLKKAQIEGWSARQLHGVIKLKTAPGKVVHPNDVRAMSLEYAHFRRHVEALADTSRIRSWIELSPVFLITQGDFLKEQLRELKKTVAMIETAMATGRATKERKQSRKGGGR